MVRVIQLTYPRDAAISVHLITQPCDKFEFTDQTCLKSVARNGSLRLGCFSVIPHGRRRTAPANFKVRGNGSVSFRTAAVKTVDLQIKASHGAESRTPAYK